ncbi:MAG TPA: LCP family protein [Firmicutes bacterium]|nr:LCP family protein [Bacillota bacterium]
MLSPEEIEQRKAELEARRELKRKYRRRQAIIYTVAVIFGLILMMVVARYSYRQAVGGGTSSSSVGNDRLHILVLGTDNLAGSGTRADTILVASVDSRTGDVGMLSIPRDTRVWLRPQNRWDRVNAAYAYGGPELVMDAVSHLLNVPISYYVQTDFEGFSKIVDILGGIEMVVEREMIYEDKAQNLYIHLTPGKQVLDGEKALQYVRYRDRLGDIALVDPFKGEYAGRVERQRKFLSAVVDKVLSPGVITRLPQLISEGLKMVKTNLPWDVVLNLAVNSGKFSPDRITSAVLPGNSQVLNGAWYWIVNEQKAAQLVDTIIWGKPEPLKLTVLNGNGRSGVAQQVANLLREAGYEVVSLGNAQHFDFRETQIVVAEQDRHRVDELAALLNAAILVQSGDGQAAGTATIIVGGNFSSQRSVGI